MILKTYNSSVSMGISIILIMSIGLGISTALVDIPEVSFYYEWENKIQYITSIKWLNAIITTALLLVNSFLINKVYNQSTFFTKSSILPAFIYLFLVSASVFDIHIINLATHSILILFINEILKIDQNKKAINQAFMGGFYIGLAAVLSLYNLIFIFILWIALASIKNLKFNEFLASCLGGIIPIIYLISAQWVLTNQMDLGLYDQSFHVPEVNAVMYCQMILSLLITAIVFYEVLAFYRHNTLIAKKQMNVIFVMLFVCLSILGISYLFFDRREFTFVIPLAFLFSIGLTNAPKITVTSWGFTILLLVNLYKLFI